MKKKEYAIFDLDYTLLPYDTILLFTNFILKKYRWRIYYIFFIIPLLPFFIFKIISSKQLKEVFLSFLWRLNKNNLEELCIEFVENYVIPNIYSELLEEIKKNKSKFLVLNTAAPDFYAKIIGKKLGFDYVFATEFKIPNKINLFPKVLGENNKSYEKIKKMLSILEKEKKEELEKFFSNPNFKKMPYPVQLKNSISYSDNRADLPLLRLTEFAKIVNPENQSFIQEALARNWEILKTQKPFKNKFQKYKIAVLQCLGLW